MSKAKTLYERIVARVETISVANGYLTEIGAKVFGGRLSLDESALPCSVVVESDDNVEDSTETKAKVAVSFVVEGHDQCDPDNPNAKAHDIVTDLKRAIFGGDRSFGGIAVDKGGNSLRYEGKSFGTRPDGGNTVAASIRFTAVFVEDLTNP